MSLHTKHNLNDSAKEKEQNEIQLFSQVQFLRLNNHFIDCVTSLLFILALYRHNHGGPKEWQMFAFQVQEHVSEGILVTCYMFLNLSEEADFRKNFHGFYFYFTDF